MCRTPAAAAASTKASAVQPVLGLGGGHHEQGLHALERGFVRSGSA